MTASFPVASGGVQRSSGSQPVAFSNRSEPKVRKNSAVLTHSFKARRRCDGPYALTGIDRQLPITGQRWQPRRDALIREFNVIGHQLNQVRR